MPLVLSERDYKLLVLFTKIAGIFLLAGGSIVLVDPPHRIGLGLGLIVAGILVAMAPVPMSVVQPREPDEAIDGAPAAPDLFADPKRRA